MLRHDQEVYNHEHLAILDELENGEHDLGYAPVSHWGYDPVSYCHAVAAYIIVMHSETGERPTFDDALNAIVNDGDGSLAPIIREFRTTWVWFDPVDLLDPRERDFLDELGDAIETVEMLIVGDPPLNMTDTPSAVRNIENMIDGLYDIKDAVRKRYDSDEDFT